MTAGAQPAASRGLLAEIAVERRDFRVEVSLSLDPGERMALYGTSGAGKSTILEAIAGGLRLSRGQVLLDGRVVSTVFGTRRHAPRAGDVVPERDRQISFVRQPTTLFPHLSVSRNVTYGLTRPGQRPAVLDEVGLTGFDDVPAAQLSGGQRQRVALARALGRGFRALLLDEPFSAVDVAARATLRELAEARVDEEAAVGLLVTHELTEAQAFGHRIAVLDSGRILQVGDPHDLVLAPASRRVAELCGYTAFVPAPGGGLFALHPERFATGSRPDLGPVVTGTVKSVQGFGPRWVCFLEIAGEGPGTVLVQVRVDHPPQPGTAWEVTAIAPPRVTSVPGGEQ